jgi:phage head maturation protease
VARLYDVSPVTYPAYPATEVQVARSVFDALEEMRARKRQEEEARLAEIKRKNQFRRMRADLNFLREVM